MYIYVKSPVSFKSCCLSTFAIVFMYLDIYMDMYIIYIHITMRNRGIHIVFCRWSVSCALVCALSRSDMDRKGDGEVVEI